MAPSYCKKQLFTVTNVICNVYFTKDTTSIPLFFEGTRAYAHDVMAAILVFQNNETATMLVYQTNPVRVQLFSYGNSFFCSNKFAWLLDTQVNTLYTTNL